MKTKLSIVRDFVIAAPRERVYRALTDGGEVRRWWTPDAELGEERGTFRWRDHGWTVEVAVLTSSPALVVWKVISSNMQDTDAWEGTTIAFHIAERRDGRTALSFSQKDYKLSPCHAVCDDGWSYVLGLSLRAYLETGTGLPYAPKTPAA